MVSPTAYKNDFTAGYVEIPNLPTPKTPKLAKQPSNYFSLPSVRVSNLSDLNELTENSQEERCCEPNCRNTILRLALAAISLISGIYIRKSLKDDFPDPAKIIFACFSITSMTIISSFAWPYIACCNPHLRPRAERVN
jgi:hypothetical protein